MGPSLSKGKKRSKCMHKMMSSITNIKVINLYSCQMQSVEREKRLSLLLFSSCLNLGMIQWQFFNCVFVVLLIIAPFCTHFESVILLFFFNAYLNIVILFLFFCSISFVHLYRVQCAPIVWAFTHNNIETPLGGQPKEVKKKCLQYWSWLLVKMTFVRRDQIGPC